MLPSLSLPLEDFDISSRNGFLPDSFPLQRLPNSYYQPWENVIADLPETIKSHHIRCEIDHLPVLSTSFLVSEAEWRRAYVILGFFTHAYIWGGERPLERLPSQVSVPFLVVADHFGLPTTATYAGLNLWNYAPKSPELSLCDPDNLRSLHTFTGTKDEEWFYLISVAMEARGGCIIPTMIAALDAVSACNATLVTSSLLVFANTLHELGGLLDRMYEHCDPHVFYHRIRPMLAGSKNMSQAGLPNGVFYDEGDGRGQWRTYSGGSNAQSSLIQFFDEVLGIEHKATGETAAAAKTQHHGFNKEMRRYMPAPHSAFLATLSSTLPPLRIFIRSRPLDHPLTSAYNAAVAMLAAFRDRHIQIVTRYIILPSRSSGAASAGVGAGGEAVVRNLATVSLRRETEEAGEVRVRGGDRDRDRDRGLGLQGTGGTMLMPFLKQTRDETREAARLVR